MKFSWLLLGAVLFLSIPGCSSSTPPADDSNPAGDEAFTPEEEEAEGDLTQ